MIQSLLSTMATRIIHMSGGILCVQQGGRGSEQSGQNLQASEAQSCGCAWIGLFGFQHQSNQSKAATHSQSSIQKVPYMLKLGVPIITAMISLDCFPKTSASIVD